MSPFSIVPPSNYRRRPRVRLGVRPDVRPFAPATVNAAWAIGSGVFLLAVLYFGMGA